MSRESLNCWRNSVVQRNMHALSRAELDSQVSVEWIATHKHSEVDPGTGNVPVSHNNTRHGPLRSLRPFAKLFQSCMNQESDIRHRQAGDTADFLVRHSLLKLEPYDFLLIVRESREHLIDLPC